MKKNIPHFYLLFTLLPAGMFLTSSAQQNIQGIADTLIHPTPIIGFNANGHFPNANWAVPSFIDSAVVLNAEIFRYPGGTNSNYWDWKTGWWKPPYGPPITPLTIRPEEFQNGLNATGAEGLFVLNYLTSDINYQMAGLRHIDSLGMNVNYVEIGNEHNLTSATDTLQFVYPSVYGQDCKVWCDSIKNAFPTAQICLVGGAPPATSQWHDSILYFNPDMNAFAWHVYPDANNTDLVFNVNRALSVPFSYLPNRYAAAKFNILPPNVDVWVTEYNLWETQFASSPVIAQTWTHALYVTAMNHYFLTKPKIKMLINHSLASNTAYYQSISSTDHHITANGVAMRLLLDVAKSSDTTQRIVFNPSPTLTYGATTYPKLIGWKFYSQNAENGFICNFSSDTFALSLGAVFGQSMLFNAYYADTALIVNGLSNLNHYSGNSNDIVTIYPFSITQINKTLPTAISEPEIAGNNELWIYPNPAQGTIMLKLNHFLSDAEVLIYNAMGQEVRRMQHLSGKNIKVATADLARGGYIVKIKNGSELMTTKFLVK